MRWYYIKFIPTPAAPDPKINNFLMEYGSSAKGVSPFDPSGANLAGALEIEFSLDVSASDQWLQYGILKIYNPPLETIQKAFKYKGMKIEIYAGFAKFGNVGYPLALSEPTGLIGYGDVISSYANYLGTDMALVLVLSPPNINQADRFSFNWQKGMLFEQAMNNTLKVLNPASADYVWDNTKQGFEEEPILWPGYDVVISSNNFTSFCKQIRNFTAAQLNVHYSYGANIIILPGNNILIDFPIEKPQDGTQEYTAALDIKPEHIIGQPTISFNDQSLSVQSVHPLRSDIRVGIGITMRDAYPQFVPGKLLATNNPLTFANKTLLVQYVRHTGKFRDTSAQGWVTSVESTYVNG